MSAIFTDLQLALDYIESGNLPAAHAISQQYECDVLADSIHAIIHRREGDYSNSLYWWCRVGSALPNELAQLYGDPADFTIKLRTAKSDETSEIESRETTVLKNIIKSRVSKGEE